MRTNVKYLSRKRTVDSVFFIKVSERARCGKRKLLIHIKSALNFIINVVLIVLSLQQLANEEPHIYDSALHCQVLETSLHHPTIYPVACLAAC